MESRAMDIALDKYLTREPDWCEGDGDDERVESGDECPTCGENRSDYLEWIDDGERLRCGLCATRYTPASAMAEEDEDG